MKAETKTRSLTKQQQEIILTCENTDSFLWHSYLGTVTESSVVMSPSWPSLPAPQENSWPRSLRARLWDSPHATWTMFWSAKAPICSERDQTTLIMYNLETENYLTQNYLPSSFVFQREPVNLYIYRDYKFYVSKSCQFRSQLFWVAHMPVVARTSQMVSHMPGASLQGDAWMFTIWTCWTRKAQM